MESIDHLTATLNTEKDTITDALDVTGPAIEVLAAQHDELIAMLRLAQPARRGRAPG